MIIYNFSPRFEFEEFEHVCDLKYVALKSEGTVSGLKGYISIATNFSHGEEVTSRGKVKLKGGVGVHYDNGGGGVGGCLKEQLAV